MSGGCSFVFAVFEFCGLCFVLFFVTVGLCLACFCLAMACCFFLGEVCLPFFFRLSTGCFFGGSVFRRSYGGFCFSADGCCELLFVRVSAVRCFRVSVFVVEIRLFFCFPRVLFLLVSVVCAVGCFGGVRACCYGLSSRRVLWSLCALGMLLGQSTGSLISVACFGPSSW